MLEFLAQAAQEGGTRNTLDALARTPLSQVLMFVAICTAIRLIVAPKLSKTPPHMRRGGYTVARLLNEFMDALIYAAVFVFMLIRPFAIQTFTIPTGSMKNTLMEQDYIIANKAIYRYSDPQFGDIVVFKPPVYGKPAEQVNADIDYIKRCRGVPGDLIEIRNGVFFRNNQAVQEPFVRHAWGGDKMAWDFKLVYYKGEYWPVLWDPGQLPNPDINRTVPKYVAYDDDTARDLQGLPPAKIPPGHFLMMGDNREESSDGRMWGLVDKKAIIGKSMFIWLPPGRWGVTR